MKFGPGIHSPQRTNPADFGNPLDFCLVQPASQVFHSSSEISQFQIDGLEKTFVQIFTAPRQWSLLILILIYSDASLMNVQNFPCRL